MVFRPGLVRSRSVPSRVRPCSETTGIPRSGRYFDENDGLVKTLVTGSTGFVGRHLVEHLEACGDEVAATSRAEDHLDLLNASALTKAVAEVSPEVVFHLAGQANVGRSWEDPTGTLRVNAEGTLNLLAAARSTGVERVVTVTSADIYGAMALADLPIGEEAPLRPVSPYAVSKAAADLIALQAHLGHGQDVVRARSFNHLGRGQSEATVCAALAARIAANERSGNRVVRVGNLEARRDFTDVRDVVRAYRMLAVDGQAGTAYNVCSGQAIAVTELANQLLALAEAPMHLEVDPTLLRPVDIQEFRGDPSRLQDHTKWAPIHTLDNTLAEMLDDWRTRVIKGPTQ